MYLKICTALVLSALSFGARADFYNPVNPADLQAATIHLNGLWPQENWKKQSDSLYTIQYPANWEMNYTGQKGLSFVVVSPLENNEDKFRENLSLVIQSMSADDSSLKDFAEDNTFQIVETISNGKIMKNEEKSVNGVTYREVIYSGSQNNMDFINTQRYYFYNDNAFVLTFTCVAPHYDRFKPQIKEIMDSMKFK